VATARAEAAALDGALGRLRATPASAEVAREIGWLVHALANGQGARRHRALAGRARALAAALRGAPAAPLAPALLHELDLLRHQLEASLATARTEAALRQGLANDPIAGAPSPLRQRLLIAVLGDGLESACSCRDAWLAGAALAASGANLMTGGMGGVMQAAARGFRESGGEGLVVGLLPGGERHAANPWIDLPLPTGVDQAQCALVAEAADGAIAIGGGGGTLAEIALLLRHDKPVAALADSGGAASSAVGMRFGATPVIEAPDPRQAVLLVLRALAV
jgi:uncharacterized protein (TIGR00725 family)